MCEILMTLHLKCIENQDRTIVNGQELMQDSQTAWDYYMHNVNALF